MGQSKNDVNHKLRISALANVFNTVYIKRTSVEMCWSQFRYGNEAKFYENQLIISAFICEFFAGVVPPHYLLKRDYFINRRGFIMALHNMAAPSANQPRNLTTDGSVQ